MTIVSTAAFYDSNLFSISALQSQATTLQTQISTGNRLQASSDDPVAAAMLRAYAQADALDKVDTANTDTAQANLSLADTAMTSFTDIVQRIQTLTTQAASATVNDSQRANLGTEITSLGQNLVALANSRDAAGNALFGGETPGAAYSVDASGNASYVGTASAPQTALGSGLTVSSGVTGPQFLNFTSGGTATDLLSLVKNLGAALQTGGAQAAAQTALTGLSDGLNAIGTAQTLVGARQAWIDTTNTVRTQIDEQRTKQESNVGSADVTTAVTKLQQTMTALQASQASFVKLSSLSLFSLIQA